MSDNMFKFIMTLVPVFGAIITYFVIPYIKSKLSQTQMEEIIFMLLASWAEREGKE